MAENNFRKVKNIPPNVVYKKSLKARCEVRDN
jgi:hypothetical protein